MVSAKIVVFTLILSAFPSLSQEKVKFPVGASSKTLGYGPRWVAWKQGFFDQQGLDAQVILLRGTPPTGILYRESHLVPGRGYQHRGRQYPHTNLWRAGTVQGNAANSGQIHGPELFKRGIERTG
jgi:hypothetical protein